MKTLNVKTGDTVVVIAGKDAGKQGKVLKTFPSKNRIIGIMDIGIADTRRIMGAGRFCRLFIRYFCIL